MLTDPELKRPYGGVLDAFPASEACPEKRRIHSEVVDVRCESRVALPTTLRDIDGLSRTSVIRLTLV